MRARSASVAALVVLAGHLLPSSAAAQRLAAPCDALVRLIADMPSVAVVATDSIVQDERRRETVAGCRVELTGSMSTFRRQPVGWDRPEDRLNRQLPTLGWTDVLEYMADGHDGSQFAYTRSNVLCIFAASYDGGDDADPTYVPEDRYQLVIQCRRAP